MPTLFDTLMKPKLRSDVSTLGAIAEAKKTPMGSLSALPEASIKQQGAEALAEGQRQAVKEAGLGEQALADTSIEAQKAESARNIALQRLADKNDQRIASLGHEAASQMAADSRKFKLDEANRKYMNQTMIDQYAAEKLMDDESMNNYIQNREVVMQRKAQLMNTYAKKLEQILTQGYIREGQELDQISKEKIARLHAAYKQKEVDAIKKANKSSIMKQVITGAFAAGGAVAGGVFGGGPVGAVAGSSAGSVLGAVASENIGV